MKQICILFLISFFTKVVAQNPIGIPQINTYTGLDYKGGSQNWDVDQDRNGILYFANNEGLLAFDGRHWKLYALPHKTIVRSVKLSHEGKIYVGAQDEIGYFFPNQKGVLKYHSLKNLIPANERQFSDIWDIVIIRSEIFFRTNSKILHLKDGIFKVYKPERLWEFMTEVSGKLYAQDIGKGLLEFKDGAWQTLASTPEIRSDYITSILDYAPDTLLVTTLKKGLFLLGKDFFIRKISPDDQQLKVHRIYKAIKVDNGRYAIATSSAGCYIIDKQGKILQQFSLTDGLHKNNLRSIFLDNNKDLWLGLDDGINFIAFNNAVKYIYPDKDKQISSYSTLIYDNKLYVGTSNGVFYSNLKPGNTDLSYSKQAFNEVAGTSGQVWSLREINRHVLLAHEDGAYVIEGNQARQIKSMGTWMFEPLSLFYPSKDIIAGTYLGLHAIEFSNNQFIDKGPIKGINETLRFITYDNDMIWASHPYRGIYRFKLSADKRSIAEIKLFTEKDGLPSALENYVAKIKNRIVIATKDGIYEFNERKQRFAPSALLTPILKKNIYHYLKEDNDGDIWFVSDKRIGMVDFNGNSENKEYAIVHFPELNSKVVAGFENIYAYDKENIFIGANNGLIHINYKKYVQNIRPISVTLSSIKTTGKEDSIIYGGYFLKNNKIQSVQDNQNNVQLDRAFNSLHFEYSSTLYEQQNNIEFSYQLSGFDRSWSEWSPKSEKDYTNLPHGDYVFKVKARNNLGNESKLVTYSFAIKPAWYETYWIYMIYTCALFGIIYLLILRQKKKHEKQQEYLKYQHQLEIEHNEKEIVKLRNEKLEFEVNFKNKELATTSLHLVQKNKLLSKIKEGLLPLVKIESLENHAEELKRVLRLLNEAEKGDADWEQFAIHFDQIHSNFLSSLKEKFPNLSANDLKLCAYLKMNLSSKEMAQLMNITIRAVEVSRYRLRKKLQVSSSTNLFDYLIQVTGPGS